MSAEDDFTFLDNYNKQIKEITFLMKSDRAAIIQKAFELGMQELFIRASIEKYNEGNISLGRAAEMADLSYIEMFQEMHKRGVSIRYGNEKLTKELNDI